MRLFIVGPTSVVDNSDSGSEDMMVVRVGWRHNNNNNNSQNKKKGIKRGRNKLGWALPKPRTGKTIGRISYSVTAKESRDKRPYSSLMIKVRLLRVCVSIVSHHLLLCVAV